jgi:hypothetical protein
MIELVCLFFYLVGAFSVFCMLQAMLDGSLPQPRLIGTAIAWPLVMPFVCVPYIWIILNSGDK